MAYHIRLKLPEHIQDDVAARKARRDFQAWLNSDVADQRAIVVDGSCMEADLDRISVMVAEWGEPDAEAMIDGTELWEGEREVCP